MSAYDTRALNEVCPWTGRPVHAEGITLFRGYPVGFADRSSREEFEKAVALFEALIVERRIADHMAG